jgi:DNA-binding beta-propeller fold protein YncE
MTRRRLPLGAAILILLSVATSAQAPIKTIAGYGKGRPTHPDGPPCDRPDDGVQAKAVCFTYFEPGFVAVGPDGTIYYSEYGRVRKFDSTGAVTTVAGGRGAHPPCLLACFDNISGLAFDPDGNLLISEFWGDKVFKLTPGGVLTVLAGSRTNDFCGDNGPAIDACLNGPAGLAADAAGNVYIAEYQGHRIRRVDSSGVISTFAGNGTLGFCGDDGTPRVPACSFRAALP